MIKRPGFRNVLSTYDRHARLKPGLLVALPVSLFIGAMGSTYSTAAGVMAATLSGIGFSYVISQFARDPGRNKQAALFAMWGGSPTVAKLRHRDRTLNPHTRERYHKVIGRLIGKALPTLKEENENATAADLVYEEASDFLREKTRDIQKFPLLFDELTSYGFRRNLWGLKELAVPVSILALFGQFILIAMGIWRGRQIAPFAALATLTNLLQLVVWTKLVKPSWVKTCADSYAERLLASCVELVPAPTRSMRAAKGKFLPLGQGLSESADS
jgi:hypothetical protein